MILGTYHDTYGELKEDEWLLKLREDQHSEWENGRWVRKGVTKVGFLTKLTQKGDIPKAFASWGGTRYGEDGKDVPVYVFKETRRSGWKIIAWRFGKSQNWAVVRHPEGFTLEIYLTNFLEIMKEDTVDKGYLTGKYIWSHHKLIKQ